MALAYAKSICDENASQPEIFLGRLNIFNIAILTVSFKWLNLFIVKLCFTWHRLVLVLFFAVHFDSNTKLLGVNHTKACNQLLFVLTCYNQWRIERGRDHDVMDKLQFNGRHRNQMFRSSCVVPAHMRCVTSRGLVPCRVCVFCSLTEWRLSIDRTSEWPVTDDQPMREDGPYMYTHIPAHTHRHRHTLRNAHTRLL